LDVDERILERLIMDRSLGELPAETAALLEDYLEARPEASLLAQQVESTLRAARLAMAPSCLTSPDRLPPLRRVVRKAPAAFGRRWPSWWRPISVAAAMVLAFLAGARVSPRPVSVPLIVSYALMPRHDADNTEGFWSLRRADRSVASPARQLPVIWTNPTIWPRIGDKS